MKTLKLNRESAESTDPTFTLLYSSAQIYNTTSKNCTRLRFSVKKKKVFILFDALLAVGAFESIRLLNENQS